MRRTIEESRGLGYACRMLTPDWFANKDAIYVLAAYGAAGTILLALLFASLRAWKCRQKEWRRIESKRNS